MDFGTFVNRVVAPGNYLVVFQKPADGPGWNRWARRDTPASAAGYVREAVRHRRDAYYAMASFRDTEPHPKSDTDPKFRGLLVCPRTHDNVQALQAFWCELDVRRTNDGKDDAKAFATREDALRWLGKFVKDTGLPMPNVIVDSGYGWHVYWVLAEAIGRASWQPVADALQAAMIHHNATTDHGVTIDSARVLRPPGSHNFKGGGDVEVKVVHWKDENYTLAQIAEPLQPFHGVRQQKSRNEFADALSRGQPPKVAVLVGQGGVDRLAAGVDMHEHKPSLAKIAEHCNQIRTALDTHGAGYGRDEWMQHILLAAFCEDGDEMAHKLSDGWSKPGEAYDPAVVDRELARVRAHTSLGPPRCDWFQRHAPARCQGCPFAGQITTPAQLGQPDPSQQPAAKAQEPPPGWRFNMRHDQHGQWLWLERREIVDKKAKEIEFDWVPVVRGEFSDPKLYPRGKAFDFSFAFRFTPHEPSKLVWYASDAAMTPQEAWSQFSSCGMHVTGPHVAAKIQDFAMAWIEKLRLAGSHRYERPRTFGWHDNGFAVGGIVYRPDGSTDEIEGPQPNIDKAFRPHGDPKRWTQAAKAVLTGAKPEVEVLIAASFAGPLIEMTGHPAAILNVWSRASGFGKTTAMRVGQNVWSGWNHSIATQSTANAARTYLTCTAPTTVYWDEFQFDPKNPEEKCRLIFDIIQGRDRMRLKSDATLSDIGAFSGVVVLTSNRPVVDKMAAVYSDTNAGAVRVLDMEYIGGKMPNDPKIARLVQQADKHTGHAGAQYAAYLAKNRASIDKKMGLVLDEFTKHLDAPSEERIFVALSAAICVGAEIAKRIGIYDFDLTRIASTLRRAILHAREARAGITAVTQDGYDLEKLLFDFAYEMSPRRVVTDIFRGPGRSSPMKLLSCPQDERQPIVMHIAQDEGKIRFHLGTLELWIKRRHLSWSTFREDMLKRLGATMPNTVLGGGLANAPAKSSCFELDCSRPSLEPLLMRGELEMATPLNGQAPALARGSTTTTVGASP